VLYFWNFILYPAGSYFLPLLAIGIFLGVFLICEWRSSYLWINIFFLSTIFGGIYLLLNGQVLLSRIFNLTGKQNNSSFRSYLLQRSLEQVRETQLFGSLYKGDLTKAKIGSANIVSHNDYVNMLLGGGFLLILIFSTFITYILVTSTRKIKQLQTMNNDCRMLIALNIALITFLLLSNFLALLSKPSNSIMFFSLIFAITLLTGKKSLR
jgi:MFS family permease